VESVMEIVIDGLNEKDIAAAMRAGIRAVCTLGRKNGIIRVSAGHYGGKLGPYLFHLHKVLK
jgi:formylmethanofuran--tetrahydromethanopterin N-formyltransferase